MKDINEKIESVKDEHYSELAKQNVDFFDNQLRSEADQFRGALRAVGAIHKSLSAKLIEGAAEVEEKKFWRVWGFESFADYLNSGEIPEITNKNKYYDLRSLLAAEGHGAFDLFTGQKIPVSTRKRLAASGVNIEVDGDELIVADQRVPVSDPGAVREVIEAVHAALKERDTREEKLQKNLDKAVEKNQTGEAENERLRRENDALRSEGSRFTRAIMHALDGLFNLIEAVGELSDDEKASRKSEDLKLFAAQYFRIQDAYGEGGGHVPLARPSDGEMDTIDRAIAEMDMEDLD